MVPKYIPPERSHCHHLIENVFECLIDDRQPNDFDDNLDEMFDDEIAVVLTVIELVILVVNLLILLFLLDVFLLYSLMARMMNVAVGGFVVLVVMVSIADGVNDDVVREVVMLVLLVMEVMVFDGDMTLAGTVSPA